MDKQELPAFDSVVKALVFAFNASDAYYIASPVMNKAMAEVPVKKKRAKKGANAEQDEETKPRPSPPPMQPAERLQGLSKAMQAGFILLQVKRLEATQQAILAACYTHPTNPCQCQRPCCQGFQPTPRWSKAIAVICDALKENADVIKQPGKRGLSTEPTLRRLLVERYFLGGGMPTAKLARIAKISTITATKHDEWITSYLEAEETEARIQIATIFDQEGITGLLL
jgi:hypothetical protein